MKLSVILTDETLGKISILANKGHNMATIGKFLRISHRTLHRALEIAREELEKLDPDLDKPEVKLSQAIDLGNSTMELEMVDIVTSAASVMKDWKAAAWYLERKHKDTWSQKTEVENSGGSTVRIINDFDK